MKEKEYKEIEQMTNRLIAFINWKGAPFEDKKKKIIKEISMIKEYCKKCSENLESNKGH